MGSTQGAIDDAVEEYDSINLVDGKYTWVPNLPKLITSMPAYVPSACNDDQSLFMGAPEEDVTGRAPLAMHGHIRVSGAQADVTGRASAHSALPMG